MTLEPENEEAWKPIATRGNLELVILTRSQAEKLGKALHPDAQYFGVIHPDGEPPVELGFFSVQSIKTFCDEMLPREIHIMPSAMREGIEATLSRNSKDPLH